MNLWSSSRSVTPQISPSTNNADTMSLKKRILGGWLREGCYRQKWATACNKNSLNHNNDNFFGCTWQKTLSSMFEQWIWHTVEILHPSQLEPSRLLQAYRFFHQLPLRQSSSQSRSYSCSLQKTNNNHNQHIHDDNKLSCNFSPKKEQSSPLVQVPATPDESKQSMDMKDHHDAPVSQIATPKKLKRVQFVIYPSPPLPSPDYYAGEFLNKDFINNNLDSEDQKPESSPGWWNDNESYGSYCHEDKTFSCKRPPTISKEKTLLYNFRNDPKRLPFWAILEIQVHLQPEYTILVQACFAADTYGREKTEPAMFYQVQSETPQKIGMYPTPKVLLHSKWEG